MEENYLQAGFEIKLACDALSRRVLRWHWEKTPRPNTLKELMHYVRERSEEAPDYYANSMPQSEKINLTWQQLDTTFCMRVLLDSEANATKPKRLLGDALHEGAARHACNGLRIARNAAAHATDKAGVVKAIATFDETLDDLERAYGLTLFKAEELTEYDALVTRATNACKAKKPAGKQTASVKSPAHNAQSGVASSVKATATTSSSAKVVTRNKTTAKSGSKANATRAKRTQKRTVKQTRGTELEKGFIVLAVVVFLLAFVMQLLRM